MTTPSNKLKEVSLLDARKELALAALHSYAPAHFEKLQKHGSLSDPIDVFLTTLELDLDTTKGIDSCYTLKSYIGAPNRKLFNKYYIPGIKIDGKIVTLRRIVFFLNNIHLADHHQNTQVRVTNTCSNISCLNLKHLAVAASTISHQDRIDIAHEYNAGKSISQIAKDRGLSISTIQHVVAKDTCYANNPVEIIKRERAKVSKTCFYKEQVMDKLNKRSVMKENGCRIYLGGQHKDQDGGGISYQGKSVKVAYFVWQCANRPIPENHIIVHTCGNKMCFALNHLATEYHNKFGISKAHLELILTSPKPNRALARELGIPIAKVKRIQTEYATTSTHSDNGDNSNIA